MDIVEFIPQYLYHCTPEYLADSILTNGLKLEYSRLKNKQIYLSVAPEYCYGNTCFIIETTGLSIYQTINRWEYVCNDDISSERISYYGYLEVD